MKPSKKQLLLLAAIAIALFLAYLGGITEFFGLEELKIHRAALQHFVQDHYFYSVALFISLYIFIATCSIPIAAFMTTAGGFLFGAMKGAFYSYIAASVGAIGIFLIARHFIGSYIQKRYHKKLSQFNAEMDRYGANFLLIMRFIPFPFFIINIVASLTNISLWTFIWTTAIGIIPDIAIYSLAGEHLNHIEAVEDIISWRIFGILSLLIFFSALPIIIKKMNTKKRTLSKI